MDGGSDAGDPVTSSEIIAASVGLLGAAGSIAAVLVGLGRVLSRLDTIATEHASARAESRAQHEETRREIGALREARVAGDATAEHLRADLDAVKDSLREVRTELREQTDARHKLRGEMHELLAAIRGEIERAVAPRNSGR